MTIPQLALLAFALWTISVPLGAVGYYRWSRILAGSAAIHDFRADLEQGSDWYRRAMRAHANCVENLPVLGAIVLALTVLRVHGGWVDVLSIVLMCARVGQSLTHIGWTETRRTTSVRFSFFMLQVLCMYALAGKALATVTGG